MDSKAKLEDAEPVLQEFFVTVKRIYEDWFPDRILELTSVHRTPEEQQALYAKGRTAPGQKVTNIDGVNKKSNHNYLPSRAIDVVVKGRFSKIAFWDPVYYVPLKKILFNEGYDAKIRWGGDFNSIMDYPHFETK